MTMHMAGFKRAVKKLAKDRYHCVRLQIVEYEGGRTEHNWSGYIEGADWTWDYKTPEEALKALKEICSASE